MSASRLIICEKTGRWAVAFRRALAAGHERIAETRGLAGCSRQLAAGPASIVAVEVTAANLDAVLAAVPEWLRRFPHCRTIALLEPEVDAAEALLREAGVVAVLRSTRGAPAIARLAQRHLATAPADNLPLEQAILNSLPWAKWATQSA